MPLVSVIIPAYNGTSRYLREAIQSVLSQTIQDFELIVVDDASQDDVQTVVPSSNKIILHKRTVNGGQACARNTGAKLSTGEFLSFLDQDDLWEPNFLEQTLTILDKNPHSALVHTDGYKVDESNQIFEYDGAIKHYPTITQFLRNGHDTATNGSLLRKKFFEEIGGYDERLTIWEDIDLGIRIFQRYPIIHLPSPLYRHRHYNHNVSRYIPSARALESREYFLEKHSPLCQAGTTAAKLLKKDWACFFRDKGKWHLSKHEKKLAQSALWKSLKYQPFSHKTFLRFFRSLFPSQFSQQGNKNKASQ